MTLTAEFDYDATELDAMAGARNYYGWILEAWRPHLGRTVLEFGAGIGTFSARLLQEPIVDRLVLVEPARTLCRRLQTRFGSAPSVRVVHGVLPDVEHELREWRLDCVVGVNVLEHIRDDAATLRAARDILAPGGRLLLFVPALQFLYGSLDRAFGHERRYTESQIRTMLADLGYEVLLTRYVNAIGTLPWLIAGRVMGHRTLTPRAVALADRTVIPMSSWLERWFKPPFGQNLLAVARKP